MNNTKKKTLIIILIIATFILLLLSALVAGMFLFLKKNTRNINSDYIAVVDNTADAAGDTDCIDFYIRKQAKCEIVSISDDIVSVKITAPDINEYLISSEDDFSDDEDIFNTIITDLDKHNIEYTEKLIDVPLVTENGTRKIIFNEDNFEYIDAVTGGLYTYFNRITTENASALFEIMEGGVK